MSSRALLALVGLSLVPSPPRAADDLPDPTEVAAAMRRAHDYFVSELSSHGGYATAWSRDGKMKYVEGKETPTILSIQPHGTTTVGLAMLRAWQATGDEAFLAGARGTAEALTNCQLESGGWPADFDFGGEDPEKWFLRRQVLAGDRERGKRANLSTLDDNKTQSALLFLLELVHDPKGGEDADFREALAYGLDRLLGAQTQIGSWPQQFSGPAPAEGVVKKAVIPADWPRVWPKEKYQGFHTLNDGNLDKIVQLLLRAHELTGEGRYLDSARRCGDFLLLARFDGDQAGWAQQYNAEMVPAWARKFEPPAVSSTESVGSCQTLMELWRVTGEEKYREAIPPVLDWLERSRLPGGKWARFYEFGSNRPLYFTAGNYQLTYDDSDLPTHYGFRVDNPADKLPRLRQDLGKSREELLAARRGPDSPERWEKAARSLRGKVKAALESRDVRGVWMDGDKISAELFVKHFAAMSSYLEALRRSGKP